jgi:hypothetical protein
MRKQALARSRFFSAASAPPVIKVTMFFSLQNVSRETFRRPREQHVETQNVFT